MYTLDACGKYVLTALAHLPRSLHSARLMLALLYSMPSPADHRHRLLVAHSPEATAKPSRPHPARRRTPALRLQQSA